MYRVMEAVGKGCCHAEHAARTGARAAATGCRAGRVRRRAGGDRRYLLGRRLAHRPGPRQLLHRPASDPVRRGAGGRRGRAGLGGAAVGGVWGSWRCRRPFGCAGAGGSGRNGCVRTGGRRLASAVRPRRGVVEPASLLVGTLAAWLAGLLATGRRPRPAALAAAGLLVVLVVAAAATPAWAHDPGQGRVRGHAAVAIGADGAAAQVRVRVLDLAGGSCGDLGPVGLAARRAGQTRRAPLAAGRGCTFRGQVGLPDRGRWFVYATLTGPEGPMETWLAVQADGRHTAAAVRELYSRPAQTGTLHPLKLVGGVALYLVGVALLLATLATARRHSSAGRAAGTSRQPT